MNRRLIVAGGAGYIGSHTVLALCERGFDVRVLDDLSEGHRDAVRAAGVSDEHFLRGSLQDERFLEEVFHTHKPDAVLHFAARCYVGESVTDPGKYWRANVGGTLNLLDAMARHDCRRLVFSSTCATYGEPDEVPITEAQAQDPINPYGATKLACERMFKDFAPAFGLATVALRYFNAAGADPAARLGEDHDPETHLIPLVLAAAAGRRPPLKVFGDDYDTPDGTCIRDYVHVTDLADAHVRALDALLTGSLEGFHAFNLGNARGTSVKEVIAAAEKVTGRPVPHEIAPRRPGDPPILVGSSERIASTLGWKPALGDIETIVRTAWQWHEKHPQGYGDR